MRRKTRHAHGLPLLLKKLTASSGSSYFLPKLCFLHCRTSERNMSEQNSSSFLPGILLSYEAVRVVSARRTDHSPVGRKSAINPVQFMIMEDVKVLVINLPTLSHAKYPSFLSHHFRMSFTLGSRCQNRSAAPWCRCVCFLVFSGELINISQRFKVKY